MKSNVSDQMRLMEAIYIDATMKCTADVFDLRDLETIRSRIEHEGLSFLTLTLPEFARDFERSLQNEQVDSTCFRNFRKHGSIPAFLQGMTSQLFNQKTGRIYDVEKNSTEAQEHIVLVESVRQICLAFKKIEISCSPEKEAAAFGNFIAIEQDFSNFQLQAEDEEVFLAVSDVLWTPIIGRINLNDCEPRHGPGATAERKSGNQKYVWTEWADRLEPYFPLIGNGYPLGLPPESEELKKLSILPTGQERPVRVVSVPKTLKSPRIIAIEPCCMQFAQQGIRDELYSIIESHWLTAGHVNFRDQGVNQLLALSSSDDGQLATIDLSDASDRVPRSLALAMFRCNPDIQDAIDACRSDSAQMPTGEIISPLRKFASMGSALCFPVEAMYFYTICVVALLRIQNLPVTLRNIYQVSRDVHVYGDDIIVPATYAVSVLDHLQKYNCKVNANKTFYRGCFRESCGVDAYRGAPVTPVYIRSKRPKNRQNSSELVSWTSTANLFYLKGYWRTASLMRYYVEKVLGPLPYVSKESSALGHISYLGYRSYEKWNRKLHRLEIKAWVPSPVYRIDKLEGYAALSKSVLGLTDRKDPFDPTDRSSLERSALHGAVTLKRRWVPSLT